MASLDGPMHLWRWSDNIIYNRIRVNRLSTYNEYQVKSPSLDKSLIRTNACQYKIFKTISYLLLYSLSLHLFVSDWHAYIKINFEIVLFHYNVSAKAQYSIAQNSIMKIGPVGQKHSKMKYFQTGNSLKTHDM